jgi:hypothetical protein
LSKEWKNGSEEFWDSVIVLAMRSKEKSGGGSGGGEMEFQEEVKEMFEGKNYEEISEMEKEIRQTLTTPETLGVMDFEYWEKVLKILLEYKANNYLRDKWLQFK